MPHKTNPVYYSSDEVGIPIMKLGEVLFARRWKDCLHHGKELRHLKREIRVRTIEWFFLFQKGPHKFVHGTYPKPSGRLLNKLLETVSSAIRIYKNEKQAVALKRLVDQLDHGQFLNIILFLLLISDVKCEETTLGAVRIPSEALTAAVISETDAAPKYSTFECSKLSLSSVNVTSPASLQVVDGVKKASRENPFTNLIDFYGQEPSVTHFFGAFTVMGPEAKHLLSESGSAPLKIPVGLSPAVIKYRYLHCCDVSVSLVIFYIDAIAFVDLLSQFCRQFMYAHRIWLSVAPNAWYRTANLLGLDCGSVRLQPGGTCGAVLLQTRLQTVSQASYRLSCSFLEQLLVHGVYDESMNEFNLHVSNVHLLKRVCLLSLHPTDVSFWVSSFRYETCGSGAGFMNLLPTHFEHCVLRCAKSIQLLKSVAPKHFVFKSRRNFPGLRFPASSSEVMDQQNSLSSYLDGLEKSALSAQSTRLQQLARAVHQRQELLRLAAETHARNLIELEANKQRIRDAHRTKQEQTFLELKMAAEQAIARRHAAIEAEKAVDKAVLEAASRLEAYRKDVITAARRVLILDSSSNELEAHYAALSRDADLRRLKAGQRIQENQFISEVLHKDGLKAQEFQVNRTTASVSFKEDECIPIDPLSGVNASRLDSPPPKVSKAPHHQPPCAINGCPTDLVSHSLAPIDQRTQVEATVQPPLIEVADLSDPLALLRAKFRQRNSAMCAPSEQMFDLLYMSERSSDLQSESPDESMMFMADSKKPAIDSVVRFRDRNFRGHVSDSTVQRMLYGSGSGPACRPSGELPVSLVLYT
ncbi:uncharacterized protein DEA37_0007459 [Paragonimus westermani]|uniref:Uncharacterized protein n=1 Tax=Paragonimus westermani TaxID=34504 RepID=A0A5J4N8Z8_9TREM|nr:uncharacterized protein DEA37_0007459 [Paragonimus westermani]